jgi:hypothetical protein
MLATGYRLLATGCWLLDDTGYRMLNAGHWVLGTGCELRIARYELRVARCQMKKTQGKAFGARCTAFDAQRSAQVI